MLAMRARSAAWVLASAMRRRHGLREEEGEEQTHGAPGTGRGINRRWAAELGARWGGVMRVKLGLTHEIERASTASWSQKTVKTPN